MKLVFYDDFKLGVLDGDMVVDVSAAVSGIIHTSPHDLMNRLIEGFSEYKARIEESAEGGTGVPVDRVRLRPPVPRPYNFVAMAVNYFEDGTRDEPAPINAFHKSSSGIIGPGDTIVLPDVPATIFEHEAELGLVIGKRATRVRAEDAFDHVFGYMNLIDVSARGLPPTSNVFFQSKARDTFAPMGPWLVTADEVPDPHDLRVKLSVNGVLRQDYTTGDMANKIPRVVEWVSSIHTLEPGDVIATGTNHRGLSAIQDGDYVDMEIEGLGVLHLNVSDDLKRIWPRETRLERENRGLTGPVPQSAGRYSDRG